MKRLLITFLVLTMVISTWAATYYVSPTGKDRNTGTQAAPFATLRKALETVGTTQNSTIYIMPGEYDITAEQFMDYGNLQSVYAIVYPIKAKGTSIIGIKDSEGNRPVLNFANATYTPALDSDGKPTGYYRISAFWLYADNITLKDFEITHVQSLYTGKTQSECISARRGSNCLVENIAMHDGMAIGYYQTHGSNNILRNCDAYNIWDEVGYGGNGEDSDGFGFHLGNTAYTGTRVINCRAWWCGDDGFDCINNKAAISFEGCWAFYNGYQPGGNTSCGNGNGFKIGGYGKPASNYPEVIPSHTIKGCIAFYNRSNGFYANHHLGGNTWLNNTAMYNNKNFDMCNYSLSAAADVKGYGHVLKNNVSYNPRTTDAHWTTIDATQCTQENNRIIADATEAEANFVNFTRLSPSNMYKIALCKARKADGSLPEIDFLVAKAGSEISKNNQGALFASSKTVALFLTAGQSNTDGRLDGTSEGEELPSYLQTANEYAQMSYHQPYTESRLGKFYAYFPTSGQTGQPSKWAYDAVTYYYIGQALKTPFYVAKTSYGGTSIDPSVNCSPSANAWKGINCLPEYGSGFHWSADETFLAATDIAGKDFTVGGTTYTGQSLLKAWIANIDAAIDAISAKGKNADIKCMIWHQGESDRNVSANYEANLKAMVAYVRQHLVSKTGESRYATLPFFCGSVPKTSKQYNAKIEAALYSIAQTDENFHVIDLSCIKDWRSDGVHFTAAGSEYFGKTLYNSLIDYDIIDGEKLTDVEYTYNPETTPEGGDDKPVLHICGDSMSSIYGDESNDVSATTDYNNGMRGWGQYMQDYITTESGIIVQDWAHTGTTSKGFYGGANYWKVVMGTSTMTDVYKLERPYVKDYHTVKEGDYVIIVFGHNDQKGNNGYKTVTESEYTTYLTKMVNEIRAKGAFPILGTSICRCLFKSGALTYLGKIDACEAAGVAHTADCAYDYPAAARRLAAELQVPCIDFNSGSAALWEDFGQGLSASLFFPNGGTTHTSEMGARAMGIYANNIIKAWNDEDLNGAGFSNYSALIDAMKADVPQYKKADYMSLETKVSEEKIWRFDNQGYADKDTIATSIVELDGLFLRATDTKSKDVYNRCISVRTGKTAVDFLANQTTMYARVPAGNFSGISATSTAGMAKSTTSTPIFAINTAGPGTLYVSMATENTSATDRFLKIMFNGEDKVSVATTSLTAYSPTTLSYHSTQGGTFFFGGTVAYRVFAVKYVPDADTSEDDLHEPTTAVQYIDGTALANCMSNRMYNLAGQSVTKGYSGIIICNGRKYVK